MTDSEDRLNQLFSQDGMLKDEHLELASSLAVETEEAARNEESANSEDIRNILLKATLPQKIKLALLGNATCRGLLIRDSNKMIQQLVLKNPRLQPAEVEEFAKNPNLSEMVLRNIAENTQWMRSYTMRVSIVFNPKSPQALSLKWMKFLNTADLRKLAKSKNVPSVITISARKKLADMSPG